MGIRSDIGNLWADAGNSFESTLNNAASIYQQAEDTLAKEQMQKINQQVESDTDDFLNGLNSNTDYDSYDDLFKEFVEKEKDSILTSNLYGSKAKKASGKSMDLLFADSGKLYKEVADRKANGQFGLSATLVSDDITKLGSDRTLNKEQKMLAYNMMYKNRVEKNLPQSFRKAYNIPTPEEFDKQMNVASANIDLQNAYDARDWKQGFLSDEEITAMTDKYPLNDAEKQTVRDSIFSYEGKQETRRATYANSQEPKIAEALKDKVSDGSLTRDDIESAFSGDTSWYLEQDKKQYYAIADANSDTKTLSGAYDHMNDLLEKDPNAKPTLSDFGDYKMLTANGQKALETMVSTQEKAPLVATNTTVAAGLEAMKTDGNISDNDFYAKVRTEINNGTISPEYAKQQGYFTRPANIYTPVVKDAQSSAAKQLKETGLTGDGLKNATTRVNAMIASSNISSTMTEAEKNTLVSSIVATATNEEIPKEVSKAITKSFGELLGGIVSYIPGGKSGSVSKEKEFTIEDEKQEAIVRSPEYDNLEDAGAMNAALASIASRGTDKVAHEEVREVVCQQLYRKAYKDCDKFQQAQANVNTMRAMWRGDQKAAYDKLLGRGKWQEVQTPYGYGAVDKNGFLYVFNGDDKGFSMMGLSDDKLKEIRSSKDLIGIDYTMAGNTPMDEVQLSQITKSVSLEDVSHHTFGTNDAFRDYQTFLKGSNK